MRVAIIGSSHSAGLGVRGRSFAVRAAELLEADATLQLSRSAQTIAAADAGAVAAFKPDVVIVSYGAAEAHVHPSRLLQSLLDRYAPAGWRGPDGVEPRPYFSARPRRRLHQRWTSASKVLLKRALIGISGGFHRMDAADFEAALRTLLDEIGPAPKILVGLWRVDDRTFPRTNPILGDHDAVLRAVAASRDDTVHVRTAATVGYWSDFLADHAHLNEDGHDRVAELLCEVIAGKWIDADAA